MFSKRPLKIISAHWVDLGLKKSLEIISAQWVDSGFAKIKLKLIAPNGWIWAFWEVKNFIGINSAQWVEWRLKKLLILADLGKIALHLAATSVSQTRPAQPAPILCDGQKQLSRCSGSAIQSSPAHSVQYLKKAVPL